MKFLMTTDMKKLLLLLMLIVTLGVSAASNDTLNAVTMVSYEQSWLDSEGTLALRNNTGNTIHNVAYRIIYLDMKGNQLDYQDYTSDVEIEPGMTKKVNIPAYEHDRYYSYYKSEAAYSRKHPFKIKFKMKAYNVGLEERVANSVKGTGDESAFLIGVSLLPAIIPIGFVIGIFALVAAVAHRMRRSMLLWVLFSFVITPFIAIVILVCLGKAYDADDYEYEHEPDDASDEGDVDDDEEDDDDDDDEDDDVDIHKDFREIK